MTTVREVFETNTFGMMAMTQAVLPQFRARKSGVVINVTSSATLAPMPLVAAYTASKAAIEGFTGSLAHELDAFNVRVKLVEPGYAPTTQFSQNSGSRMEGLIPEAYAPFAQRVFAAFTQPPLVTTEQDVAEAVWRAATMCRDSCGFRRDRMRSRWRRHDEQARHWPVSQWRALQHLLRLRARKPFDMGIDGAAVIDGARRPARLTK